MGRPRRRESLMLCLLCTTCLSSSGRWHRLRCFSFRPSGVGLLYIAMGLGLPCMIIAIPLFLCLLRSLPMDVEFLIAWAACLLSLCPVYLCFNLVSSIPMAVMNPFCMCGFICEKLHAGPVIYAPQWSDR